MTSSNLAIVISPNILYRQYPIHEKMLKDNEQSNYVVDALILWRNDLFVPRKKLKSKSSKKLKIQPPKSRDEFIDRLTINDLLSDEEGFQLLDNFFTSNSMEEHLTIMQFFKKVIIDIKLFNI